MSQVKVHRAEIYKNHLVQVFLGKFVSGEISRLEPVFDSKQGYTYPLVEAILGDPSAVDGFLKELTDAGILKKQLYDMMIICPKCGSAKVSFRYNCPHCKSFNIKKSALMEHVQCGYIDTEERFHMGSKLVCPRCHKELVKPDVDYRKAGTWCSCNECGKSFDIPVPSHFCRNCSNNFTFEEAVCGEVYAYVLSDEAKEEASLGWVLITPIREFLKKLDFEVESPGFLKGKSGASHMFDITAYRKGKAKELTVIDLATVPEGDVVNEQPVIALFAKMYDVSPERACLIAIPKISETGKRMAALYNICLIEAENQKEAIESLETLLLKK